MKLKIVILIFGVLLLSLCQEKEKIQFNLLLIKKLRITDQDSFLLYCKYYLQNDINSIDSSDVYTQLGHFYFEDGFYDSALSFYEQAYTIRYKEGDLDRTLNSKASITDVITLRGDTGLAIETYYWILARRKDKYKYVDDVNNLAALFADSYKLDSALKYFRVAISVSKQIKDNYKLGKSYFNTALLFTQFKAFDSSLYYYNKAKSIKEYYTDENQINFYQALTELYIAQKNWKQSLLYNDSAYLTSIRNDLKEDRLFALRNFSLILQNKSNYELRNIKKSINGINLKDSAIFYLNWYIDLSDSIYSNSLQERIAALNVKYNLERKNRETLLLKIKNRQKNWIVLSLLGGFALLLSISILIYRNTRQKLRIQSSEIDDLLQKQELSIIDATLTGQDRERQRIAQELHDSIGSNLAWAKMHFSTIEDEMERMKASNREKYAEMNRILEETLTDVRRISHDLYGSTVLKLGLKVAATQLVEAIQKSYAIKINLFTKNLPESGYDTEINVYRIIQELLSNSLKHAGAQRIDIQLIGEEKNLHLAYEDNGKGMDLSAGRTGIGLTSVESRVQHLKGKTHLESRPGQGFTFFADIPLV